MSNLPRVWNLSAREISGHIRCQLMPSVCLSSLFAAVQLEDVKQPPQLPTAEADGLAIVVRDATFAWDGEDKGAEEPAPTLHDIDLQVPRLAAFHGCTARIHLVRADVHRAVCFDQLANERWRFQRHP